MNFSLHVKYREKKQTKKFHDCQVPIYWKVHGSIK